MKYTHGKYFAKKRGVAIVTIIVVALLVMVTAGALGARYWYQQQLKPLNQQSTKISITVPTGYSTKQIAQLLQDKHIIRSATAFEWYVRNSDSKNSLKAGQYQLDPSLTVADLVTIIAGGKIQTKLFTILPGQRIDQIRAAFIKAGFVTTDVDAALNSLNYKNYSALVDKPSSATLEGYLYPETFQTTSSTTVKDIISQSLGEMAKALTPDIINKFQKQALSIHQAVTLASIVEQEVSKPYDRQMVAGVFLNRLKANIPLGSDVTYHYAAIITGQQPNPNIDSPYNTRLYAGLPPGPISNVSASSLNAVANPIQSDYLFFVTGDNGTTYYSKTAAEHDAQAAQYCKVLCSSY
ncbi:MAG TPA: endolytic transglycosylase MltG [Patescibacteria group bacterium]|nr:endolytic transglycosylase MltG [Patescibacteria group bacterium]